MIWKKLQVINYGKIDIGSKIHVETVPNKTLYIENKFKRK